MPNGENPHQPRPLYGSYTSRPPNFPQRSKFLVSPCSFVLLALLIAHIVYSIFKASTPLTGLLFVFLALVPTFLFVILILRAFNDPAVSARFLLSQFLIAAVPLVLIVIPFEIIFALISLLPLTFFFNNDFYETLKDFAQVSTGPDPDPEKADQVLDSVVQKFSKLVPLPVVILVLFLLALLSAGMVEEVGKWIVSRRYRNIDKDPTNGPRISARGIFACACMSGLGFATMENIGYSLMSESLSSHVSIPLLSLLALTRGVLAYVVHVGTQLYVAVAAAQNYLFMDGGRSVGMALFHAIIFHALFDSVAFISMTLVALENIPPWISLLVPVVDIILAVLLALLVRARYKGLLERENALSTQPVAPV